jgi:hypothetical protein
MQPTTSEENAMRSDGVARQKVTLESSEVAAEIGLSAHAARGGEQQRRCYSSYG